MNSFKNIALITALSLAPTAVFAAPTHTVVTEPARAPLRAQVETAPAPSDAGTRYADREQQDKKAADYKGGSVVVVMSGTALLIAILILIIIF